MQNRQGGEFAGQRRKNRVFAPVTLKMIQEASPGADDVCFVDGDQINEVSRPLPIGFQLMARLLPIWTSVLAAGLMAEVSGEKLFCLG